MRQRFDLISVLTFMIAACAIASGQGGKSQTKPDLSGTWAFDAAHSNVTPASIVNAGIKISHHDPEFKVFRTITVNGNEEQKELTYYTDGRGETNPATHWISSSPDAKLPQSAETKSKTKWSGNRIVTRFSLRTTEGIHVVEQEVVDEWKLSADGKTLTLTTTFIFPLSTRERIVVPANRPDDKRVYTLVSK